MAFCHFELCRDCRLGCFSELFTGKLTVRGLTDGTAQPQNSEDQVASCLIAYTEAVGGGGDVLVSNNCFLQQNTTASLLELYFNDSMQTVYARGGGGCGRRQRQVADGANGPMGPM